MPNKNKLILGTSSYWIINLIYKSYIYELYFQSLLLTSIMIISPLFWYYYKINSIYHKLDNYLCISILILIIIQYYSIISYIDLFFMIKCYFLSMLFTKMKKYDIQLYCHLLFRLYFYKILYLTIDNSPFNNIIFDISKYVLNNLFLNIITTNDKFNYIKYVIYSCETIFICSIQNNYYKFPPLHKVQSI